jgi:hypothetical protein
MRKQNNGQLGAKLSTKEAWEKSVAELKATGVTFEDM